MLYSRASLSDLAKESVRSAKKKTRSNRRQDKHNSQLSLACSSSTCSTDNYHSFALGDSIDGSSNKDSGFTLSPFDCIDHNYDDKRLFSAEDPVDE